jgi:hypothetical protein
MKLIAEYVERAEHCEKLADGEADAPLRTAFEASSGLPDACPSARRTIRPAASNRFIGRLVATPGGWVIIFQGDICSNAERRVKLNMTSDFGVSWTEK